MHDRDKPGFITLEGSEGVGKSTHITSIATYLEEKGYTVCVTREPGGTRLGEAVREILLHGNDLNIAAKTELLLMFAARYQHIEEVIQPALNRGEIVICDRFTDASYAYQGGGRGIASSEIETLETWVQNGLQPDLTLLFDAAVETGFERIANRGGKDRIEQEDRVFFETIRHAYLNRAKEHSHRIKVIDAEQTIPDVQAQLIKVLESVY